MRIALISLSFFCFLVAVSCGRSGLDRTEINDETISHASRVAIDGIGNGVLSIESLQQIATENLQSGMEITDVDRVLKAHRLSPVSFSNSGVSMTKYYGAGQLFDPVVSVTFRRNGKFEYHITEWSVEE
jgi:hypothetical protein